MKHYVAGVFLVMLVIMPGCVHDEEVADISDKDIVLAGEQHSDEEA